MNRKKALLIVVVTILITSIFLATVKPGLIQEIWQQTSLADAKYQQTDYATNERGTLINVPLDSRPVGRDNVENLAIAAGYDYYEIASGLDSASGETRYYAGNPTTVQNSLKNVVKSHNSKDTTVIINTSSYFNGGLVASRGYTSYSNMDQKINTLKNLLDSYTRPTYYVIMQVPRSIPDPRVLAYPSGVTATTKVDGLQAYYNRSQNKTAVQETFDQALLDWTYLHYSKKVNYSASFPTYANNFYNDFYAKYKNYLDAYNATFEEAYAYLNQLYILKNNDYEFSLVVASDYYVTSDFILENAGKSGFDWIKKDENGEVIRYCGTYYIANFAEIYEALFGPVVSGTDTTTSLVLASDLVRRNGKGVDFNFIDPYDNRSLSNTVKNHRSYYDRLSNGELLTEKSEYINRYVQKTPDSVDVYVVDSLAEDISSSEASRMVTNIYDHVEDGKNTAVLDLATGRFDETLFQELVIESSKRTNLYDLVYCGGFNYSSTALDLALAASTVYTILENDIETSDQINSFTKERITTFDEQKIRNVSTDIVYNTLVRSQSDYNSSLATKVIRSNGRVNSGVNLLDLFLHKDYTIADYDYSYTRANVSASNPWGRAFDLKLTPTLAGIEFVEEEPDVPVSGISLNRTNITVDTDSLGDTYQLNATITPSNATDKTVTWKSSSSSVASVNSSGRVTFKGVGTATITATASNGKKATCVITIEKVVPDSRPEINIENYNKNWTNESILITFSVTDKNHDISNVTINGQKITSSNGRYQFNAQNNGNYEIIATNEINHVTRENISISNIDKTLPQLIIGGDNQIFDGNTLYVTIQGIDQESGIDTITVNDRDVTTSNGIINYPVTAAGRYTVVVKDQAGNVRTSYFTIEEKEEEPDLTVPTLTVTGVPTSWTNQDIVLTIQASDADSGIKSVTVNGQEISIQNGLGRYTVTKNGTYVFVATDNAGNTYTYRLTITSINKTAPTIANIENGKVYTSSVRPLIGSSISGVKSVVLTKNGQIVEDYAIGMTISENGSYELTVTDLAGNTTTVKFGIQKTGEKPNPDPDPDHNNTNNTNTDNNTNNNNNNTNTDNNTNNNNNNNNNNNTNTDDNNTNTDRPSNNQNNENKDNNGGITIPSSNTDKGSNTNTNQNKPIGSTGNLDTTKKDGKIPQTGDSSFVDVILTIALIGLVPISIISFRRYRKNTK